MTISEGSVVTICLFLVFHMAGTIWWMSKIQTTLTFIGIQIADIMKTINDHEKKYAEKEPVTERFIKNEEQIKAIWVKIDKMQSDCREYHK